MRRLGRACAVFLLVLSVMSPVFYTDAFATDAGQSGEESDKASTPSAVSTQTAPASETADVQPSPAEPFASPAISSSPTPSASPDTSATPDPTASPEVSPEPDAEAQLESREIPEEPIDGVARVVADYLRDNMGLNNAGISAVLSGIREKSGFFPAACSEDGTVFGICQWSGQRLRSLKEFCDDSGMDINTVTAQLMFMRHEMLNSYSAQYNTILDCDNTETGAEKASRAFTQYCRMPKSEEGEKAFSVKDAADQGNKTNKKPNSTASESPEKPVPLTANDYFSILSEEGGQEQNMSVMTAEIITADFLRNEMGFNNAVTAAIMANIYDESGFQPDTLGDAGTAYGICQWGPFRRGALERFCKYNDYDVTTLGAQLIYLRVELEADYPKTLELLYKLEDSAAGAKEATRLFCKNFEVPNNLSRQIKERQKLVELMYYPMLCGEEYERFPVDQIMK